MKSPILYFRYHKHHKHHKHHIRIFFNDTATSGCTRGAQCAPNAEVVGSRSSAFWARQQDISQKINDDDHCGDHMHLLLQFRCPRPENSPRKPVEGVHEAFEAEQQTHKRRVCWTPFADKFIKGEYRPRLGLSSWAWVCSPVVYTTLWNFASCSHLRGHTPCITALRRAPLPPDGIKVVQMKADV